MKGKNVSMERVDEQFFPANTDIWIRDIDIE